MDMRGKRTHQVKVTRRYGPLRGPTSSSRGMLWPLDEALFWPFEEEKNLFYAVFAHFWFPVETLVTFSSNHSNFVRNP